mmetsp:Transcript_24450/g.47632  ORF Transcript_24450/g.47632 Transcript_24450/m.47632 type:complete len:307 (+) Transcript_24450:144-1064(+)
MEQRLTWLPYAAAAGLLSILAAVGGTLPLLLRDEAIGPMGPGLGRRRYFRSLGACFSGGLMLSAAFVHLLPEASRALDCGVEEQVEVGAMGGEDVAAEGDAGHVDLARRGLHSDDSEAGFPFAMLLCSAGLLGTMLVESLAHGAHGAHGGEHKRKGRDSPPDDGDACCTKLCPRRASPAPSDSEAGRALDGWHAEEDQEQLLLLRAHESADALTAIVTFFAFAFHSVPTPLCTLSKRLSRRSQRQLYANRRLRRLRSSKEVSARCAIRTCTFWGYSVQTCFCNSRAYSKTSTSEHLLHRYISVLLR